MTDEEMLRITIEKLEKVIENTKMDLQQIPDAKPAGGDAESLRSELCEA